MMSTVFNFQLCGRRLPYKRDGMEPLKMGDQLRLWQPGCKHGTTRKQCLKVNDVASPSMDAIVTADQPLTKDDLVGYLASGCKPKEMWRIGTEHEKFGFEIETMRPINYEQIVKLLDGLALKFGWEKVFEGDNLIGLKRGLQNISLEPGGQIELSGAPLEHLHDTCSEVCSHLYQVKNVAKEMGIGFLGIGLQPKWRFEDMATIPKSRFDILTNYYPKVGTGGLDVMFRCCTVQANLDYSSEADMIRKLRASIALQPIATALFAYSPFKEEKPNGFLSFRSHLWCDLDKKRTGMIPFVFDDSFGFERYVDYALDVPMTFVYRSNKFIDCTGLSFREFMEGKLEALPGKMPTMNDWEIHLGAIFPEVRLRRYLEMRGADVGPVWTLWALPAFWVGLLYDENALQSVLDLTSDWTTEEREMMRNQVPKLGLKTPFRNGYLKDIAVEAVTIATGGLERRCFNESVFLKEVAEVANTGVTPAERLLELYNGNWGRNMDTVFKEFLY